MNKLVALALVITVGGGCTAASVREHTVSQAMSVADMRYQEVLDNLAMVAHNTGTLPSFAITTNGIANVTNTISLDPTTAFSNTLILGNIVHGFSQETLNGFGSHNPELLWTIAPVVGEPNLEALRYACLWAVCGGLPEGCPGLELLRAPNRNDVSACPQNGDAIPVADFHFDVLGQLELIRPGWLHITSRGEVPRGACYKAHCGNTYVWVTAEDLAGLSDFTLVILDIATVDPASLVLPRPKAKVEIQLSCGDESEVVGAAFDTNVATVASFAADAPPVAPSQQQKREPGSAGKPGAVEKKKVSGSPEKKDKVTEVWDVCQEPNASGTIRISRPKAIRPITSQVPDIVPSEFTVPPTRPVQGLQPPWNVPPGFPISPPMTTERPLERPE
jgi:hypothetical protein